MSGSGSSACVFFNEGAGSGGSAYWDYYVAASGQQATARKHSLLAVRARSVGSRPGGCRERLCRSG